MKYDSVQAKMETVIAKYPSIAAILADEVDGLTTMSLGEALARWPGAIRADPVGRPILVVKGPHDERYVVTFYQNATGGYWVNMSQS